MIRDCMNLENWKEPSLWQHSLVWDDSMGLLIDPGDWKRLSMLYDQHAERLAFPHLKLWKLNYISDSIERDSQVRTDRSHFTAPAVHGDEGDKAPHKLHDDRVFPQYRYVDTEELASERFPQNVIRHGVESVHGIPSMVQYW